MKKFTEIGQFKDVIRAIKSHWDYKGKDENEDAIYSHDAPYPTMRFRGTVKMHGTNSGIAAYNRYNAETKEDWFDFKFQSRERELDLQHDNAGFMLAMLSKPYHQLFIGIDFQETCVIFGEWCGGNIQKTVALNQLPKMFVVVAVQVDGVYQDIEKYKHVQDNENGIYNILQFPTFDIDIDFENPLLAQNKIIEMTVAVEDECPVGKYFGVSGTGEGIVFESNTDFGRYIFKSKGVKHQNSKVKTLAPIDTEALEGMNEFIEYAVTENRMQQGIDKMIELGLPLEPKTTPDYLRWIYNDVVKEETDTIVKNQIDVKKLGGAIAAKARLFWMNHLKSLPL